MKNFIKHQFTPKMIALNLLELIGVIAIECVVAYISVIIRVLMQVG